MKQPKLKLTDLSVLRDDFDLVAKSTISHSSLDYSINTHRKYVIIWMCYLALSIVVLTAGLWLTLDSMNGKLDVTKLSLFKVAISIPCYTFSLYFFKLHRDFEKECFKYYKDVKDKFDAYDALCNGSSKTKKVLSSNDKESEKKSLE